MSREPLRRFVELIAVSRHIVSKDHLAAAALLGDPAFRADYKVKYAYLAGAMYKGIASREWVIALGKHGLMGFFGAGGLALGDIEQAIETIQSELCHGESFGMNLLCDLERPEREEQTVDLYLRKAVRNVEAAAFIQITPALVRYRLHGIRLLNSGEIAVPNRVLAKVSRPEVATAFMRPPPEAICRQLLEQGKITETQVRLGQRIPMSHEVCVEADSGGHTDRGVASVLLPAMRRLRDEMMRRHDYSHWIRVGAAGGIGTPEAAAAAFVMGADFILTGSINQCTTEAGTSETVKDLLQVMDIHDTAYAPAGDMFELGSKVQVLKKGVLFPGRANKLHELYLRHGSLAEIDAATRTNIENNYFQRSFEQVWNETQAYYSRTAPQKLAELQSSPKKQMASVFKWYFARATRAAMEGLADQQVNYQVHSGPALGSFNQWVKGTALENWRQRHVADIGERLMCGAAQMLSDRLSVLAGRGC